MRSINCLNFIRKVPNIKLHTKPDLPPDKFLNSNVLKRLGNNLTPKHIPTNISTILTFEIHHPYIFHTQITSQGLVLKWDKVSFTSNEKTNLKWLDVYQMAENIISILPASHLYVFNEQTTRLQHAKHFKYVLMKNTLEAMLFTLLKNKPESQVVLWKNSLKMNVFNLKIGTEIVSNATVIANILQGDKLYPELLLNENELQTYNNSDAVDKELLGSVLLRAIVLKEIIQSRLEKPLMISRP